MSRSVWLVNPDMKCGRRRPEPFRSEALGYKDFPKSAKNYCCISHRICEPARVVVNHFFKERFGSIHCQTWCGAV